MSSVVIAGDTSGSVTLAAPSVAGTTTLTLPSTSATLLTDSSSAFNIGSGQLYKDASGNIGIGTTSPNKTLEVKNTADYQIRVNNGTTAQSYDMGRSTSDGLMYFYGNQTGFTGYVFTGIDGERMRIDSNGNISAMGIYNTTTAGAVNVNVRNDGYLLRSTSALKYKTDVRDLPSIDINKFRPVVYKSKCDGDDKTKDHFGIIADEVDAVGIKELVSYNAKGEVEGFQYERLTAVLVKAIQEQQELIKQLQADVAALKGAA